MFDFYFYPDGPRGKEIDQRMRRSLADSLEYIASVMSEQLGVDTAALHKLARSMQQGERYPASTYALYTELVQALTQGNNAQALALLPVMEKECALENGPQVLALDDCRIADHAERYCRLMNMEPEMEFKLFPPEPSITQDFQNRFDRSYKLIRRLAPELADEFDELVSQVILVVGDSSADYPFDGGSSPMLWGALFLNASSHKSDIALAEVLAHESAHLLLFGFAADETLVDNPDDLLYDSPLRVDARPMDGIYHATYVSARMHWLMARLLESGQLSAVERQEAETRLQANRENFESGYEVVKAHAILTETGRSVMQEARAYMDSV